MRFSIILLFICFNLQASEETKVKDLMKKFELVTRSHKTELIDDVFSKKFLRDSGGKDEFVEKVKSSTKEDEKKLAPSALTWRKGHVNKIYYAKFKPFIDPKTKKMVESHSEMIIIEEDGKLKIDGTIGDAQ